MQLLTGMSGMGKSQMNSHCSGPAEMSVNCLVANLLNCQAIVGSGRHVMNVEGQPTHMSNMSSSTSKEVLSITIRYGLSAEKLIQNESALKCHRWAGCWAGVSPSLLLSLVVCHEARHLIIEALYQCGPRGLLGVRCMYGSHGWKPCGF